jgi:hypothetical protein
MPPLSTNRFLQFQNGNWTKGAMPFKKGRASTPSDGIYYVARFPQGWKLIFYRYAENPEDCDHSEFWEKHICKFLAPLWAKALNKPTQQIEQALHLHTYGFPRGRISAKDGKIYVLHGSDLKPFHKVKRVDIERAFGIYSKARWTDDEHEHCQDYDKQMLRELLGIKEDWEAR